MKPQVGDLVLYHVGEHDSNDLKHNHTVDEDLPAIVVRVWSATCVNLKVFCDGPNDVWVTSSEQGEGRHNWRFHPHTVEV